VAVGFGKSEQHALAPRLNGSSLLRLDVVAQ
jgi:hypothetical protein